MNSKDIFQLLINSIAEDNAIEFIGDAEKINKSTLKIKRLSEEFSLSVKNNSFNPFKILDEENDDLVVVKTLGVLLRIPKYRKNARKRIERISFSNGRAKSFANMILIIQKNKNIIE